MDSIYEQQLSAFDQSQNTEDSHVVNMFSREI